MMCADHDEVDDFGIGSEAAKDLLLHFRHSHVLFAEIVTRALDRLSEFDLVRRKTDPLDRRSVLVQRTAPGMAFLRDLRTVLADAGPGMRIAAESGPIRQRAAADARAHQGW